MFYNHLVCCYYYIALPCPSNSTYNVCSSACPTTCSDIGKQNTTCNERCIEGCECNQGFVLEGTNCVPSDTCGCLQDGFYYAVSLWFSHFVIVHCTCTFNIKQNILNPIIINAIKINVTDRGEWFKYKGTLSSRSEQTFNRAWNQCLCFWLIYASVTVIWPYHVGYYFQSLS